MRDKRCKDIAEFGELDEFADTRMDMNKDADLLCLGHTRRFNIPIAVQYDFQALEPRKLQHTVRTYSVFLVLNFSFSVAYRESQRLCIIYLDGHDKFLVSTMAPETIWCGTSLVV